MRQLVDPHSLLLRGNERVGEIIVLLKCRVKTAKRKNINIYTYRQFNDFHDGWAFLGDSAVKK
jgi:hypothetical protein